LQRSFIVLATVLSLAALHAASADASGPASARPIHYVGTSTDTVAGGDGLKGLNDACEADFGRSRVCTDTEIMASFPFPTPTTDAWVLMTVAAYDGTSTDIWMNTLGMSTYDRPNCSGYAGAGPFTGTGSYSLLVTTNGEFDGYGDCSTAYAVACCSD
jgi:hypothetical protein